MLYFECPECGWFLTFRYDNEKNIYRAVYSFCENIFEIEKEEFEKDTEIYFKQEF